LRRVLFFIWTLFSVCGGAVAFSNKPFRQWPGRQWFASALWLDVGDDCWSEWKQGHVH